MDLKQACAFGDIERVKELLENGTNPADHNNESILHASFYGHADVVKILLQDGRADPTDYDNWAIRMACKHGHTDVVTTLLQDQRVDPTDYDNDALLWASGMGCIEVVELLLQDGRVEAPDLAIREAKTEEIREMLMRYKYRVDGPEYQKLKNNLVG